MNIHSLAITALFGAATAAKSTSRERKAFLADMKNANLALHPSERSLTKDQTPSLETFSEVVNGESPISKHYRERIIQKAKFISPEEIQVRESAEASGRHLNNNNNNNNGYASGAYNYNNGQGVSSLYANNANGDAFVSSGAWNNAFGFDIIGDLNQAATAADPLHQQGTIAQNSHALGPASHRRVGWVLAEGVQRFRADGAMNKAMVWPTADGAMGVMVKLVILHGT